MNRHQGLEWPKIQARLEAHPAKLSSLNAGVHPAGNAIDIAAAMGIEVFTEEQYRELQQLGDFDTKTKSWVKTPAEIRKLGGALFCDRRYGHVFVFHNSAPSFYAARGFHLIPQ